MESSRSAIQAAPLAPDEDLFFRGGSAGGLVESRDRAVRECSPSGGAWRSSARIDRSVDGGAGDPGDRARARAGRAGRVRIAARSKARSPADLPCPVARSQDDEHATTLLRRARCDRLQGPLTRLVPGDAAERLPIAVDLYDPMNLEALESVDAARSCLHVRTCWSTSSRAATSSSAPASASATTGSACSPPAGASRPPRMPRIPISKPDRRRAVRHPEEPPVRAGRGSARRLRHRRRTTRCSSGTAGSGTGSTRDLFVLAIAGCARRCRTSARYFMGVRRPGSSRPRAGALGALMALDPTSSGSPDEHVFFRDWTPYDDAPGHLPRRDRGRQPAPRAPRDAVLVPHAAAGCTLGRVPIVCTSGDVLAADRAR